MFESVISENLTEDKRKYFQIEMYDQLSERFESARKGQKNDFSAN